MLFITWSSEVSTPASIERQRPGVCLGRAEPDRDWTTWRSPCAARKRLQAIISKEFINALKSSSHVTKKAPLHLPSSVRQLCGCSTRHSNTQQALLSVYCHSVNALLDGCCGALSLSFWPCEGRRCEQAHLTPARAVCRHTACTEVVLSTVTGPHRKAAGAETLQCKPHLICNLHFCEAGLDTQRTAF